MTNQEINAKFEDLKNRVNNTEPANQYQRNFFSLFLQFCEILDGKHCEKTNIARRKRYLDQWEYVATLDENGEPAK